MMSSATLQSSRLVRYMATAARRQGMSPTIAMRAFSSDEAAPAPAPAAPAPAASTSTGESSSSSSPAPAPESDRIHSTDIAFKPAESGWGAGKKYSSNFDKIFGGNKKKD